MEQTPITKHCPVPGIRKKGLPDIKGFQEVTLIDWEGKIASVIFLGGCNFRCGFCHSSGLVLGPESIASVPFKEVAAFLREKKGWVDGIVITGGEPTLEGEKLFNLISAVKEEGFLVKLDTNGTGPKVLERLIAAGMPDYISMDIKTQLSPARYGRAAGVYADIDSIILSKNLILNSALDYEFRTTAVPGVVTASDIIEIAKSIRPAKRYCIQQFVPRDPIDKSFLKTAPYPSEELRRMAALASEYLPCVIVRNTDSLL